MTQSKLIKISCLVVVGILMSVVPVLAAAIETDVTQGGYNENASVDLPGDAPPENITRPITRISLPSENIKRFKTDTAPELDWYQPCNGGDNLIDFYINVHDVEVSTIKSAKLTLAVWDVDFDCSSYWEGECERDTVYINGHRLTTPEPYLTGANGQWSTCTFNVEPEGIIEGDNYIEIYIDTLDEGWCVECDWGELGLELVDVKVVEIDALKDIDIKDGAGNDITDPIWKHDEPSKYDPIADAMKNRFIWTYPGSLKIKATIDAFPSKPSWKPKCTYVWWISGTDKDGTGEFTGWSGEFKVDMPQKVGKYTLTLAFTLYDDENNEINFQYMSHTLYVTYENSKLPTPKTTWLDKATDWASGATNEEAVASEINLAIHNTGWLYGYPGYGSPSGATCLASQYYDAYTHPERWTTLVEGSASCTDCVGFSNTWQGLVKILGVDGNTLKRYGKKSEGFVTKTNSISPDNKLGNAHPSGVTQADRWRFGMHQLGKRGVWMWSKFYDPTFGNNYDKKDEFIQWHQITGFRIENSRMVADLTDGHKVYLINSFGNYGWGDFEYHSPSNPSTFDPNNGAVFTGNYTVYGVDSSGNGVYNFLTIDAEVNVTKAGNYSIFGALKSDGTLITSRCGKYSTIPSSYALLVSEPGVRNVILDFSGEDIYDSGINGIYTVDLSILDENGFIIDNKSFNTPAYSYTEFGEMPAALISSTDYGRDIDGDGLFDHLTAEISVNVTRAMDYRIEGMLYSNEGHIITSSANYTYLADTDVVELNFDGTRIRKSEKDGPYILAIVLNDENYNQIDYEEYNTSAYSYTEFQSPQAEFTGTYSDWGTDINGDGAYDYLTIEAEVSAITAGNYSITGWLYDDGTEILSADNYTYLDAGTNQILLNFDGMTIHRHGVDGPYNLSYIALFDEKDTLIEVQSDAYITSAYSYADFQPPTASFRDTYSDYGLDTNGDGFFEYLTVEVGLNVTTAGNYSTHGCLYDIYGNETAETYNLTYLNTGDQTVTLNFDAYSIYKHGVNGPYNLTNLLLYDETGTLMDNGYYAYTTSAYDYTDFQRPSVILTGNYSDYGTDTDSNGLYDYLTVDVEIIVENAENYALNARLMDKDEDEIVWAATTSWLSAGLPQIMQLNFDGKSVNKNGVDGPYYLRDVYVYKIADVSQSDYVYDAYTTGAYNYTDFETILSTDLTNVNLISADPTVTSISVSNLSLSDVNETHKPPGVLSQLAYMINSTGAGNFTLKFTDIPNANLIRVYKIDPTSVPQNQWIKLDTTITDTDVTFTMSVGDPPVVFAKAKHQTTLYYPDFTDTDTPGNWRTWMGVMNTGDANTTLNLTIYNPDGSLAYSNPDFVTLVPKAAHFFRPGITAGIAQGSAIVYGDNLAGTCHVNKNGGEGTKVYTALRNASSTLYYPDFTDTDTVGNWRTWIAVMNTGDTSTTLNLAIYNTDGSVAYLNPNFVTLEPKAVHFFRPGITAGIAQGSVVVSGDNLAGTCHVNKNGGEGTKAYPAVSGDSAEALDILYKSSELKVFSRSRTAALARAPAKAELTRFEPITFPARVAYDDSAPKKAFAGDSGYDRFEIRPTPPRSPVDLETVKICLWPDWPDSEMFTTVSPAATEVIYTQPPKRVRILSYTLNETENEHRLSKPTRQRVVLGDPTTSDVTLQSSLDTQTITIDNVSNSFPMFSNAEYVNFTIDDDTITLILDVNASFDGVCNLSTLMGREVSVAGSTAGLNYTPISYQTGNYDQKWASDPYFNVTEHKLYLLSGSGLMSTLHLELRERSATAIPKVVGIGDLVCAMNITTTAEKTDARYNNLTSHMAGVGYADLYIQYAPDVTYDTTPYLPVFTHCERLEAHNIASLMNGSGSSLDYNVSVIGLVVGAAPIARELDVCNLSLNFDLEYFPITYQGFSADQKWQLLPAVNETEHRLYLLSGSGIITTLNLTLNENSTTTPISKVVGVGDLVGNYHIEALAQGSNSSDNHLASRILGVGYADFYVQYAPDTTYESTPFMPVFMQCEALEASTINSLVNGSGSSVEYQVEVLGRATGANPIPVVADTWNSSLDFDVEYFPITYQNVSYDQKWYFIPRVNESEHKLYLLSGSGMITTFNLTLNENSTTTPISKVVGVGALVGNFRIATVAQGANPRDNHLSSRIVGVGYADLYAQYAPDTSFENITFIPTFSQCEHLQMSTNTAGAEVEYDAHVLGLANGVDYLEFNTIPLDSVAINGTFDLAYHPVNVSGDVFDEEWSFTPWQYNDILVLLRGTGNVTQLNFTFNDTTSAYPEITSYGYLSGDYDITTTILPHYMYVNVNGTNVTAMDESGQGGFGITFAPPPKIIYPDFTDTDTIGNWRTWLGVMNTGDTSATLCLDVYNTDGSVAYSNSDFVTLDPKAVHFFRPGMTAGIAQGSAIVSGNNLAGTCHVNKNGGEGTKVYTALSSGSSTLNYPDFTDTDTLGNWRTWMGVMNTGDTSTTLRLDVYNPDGSLAYSDTDFVTLGPKAVHFFRPGITAGIAQGDVVVSGDSLAGTCHVNKNGGEGTKVYTAIGG